jgi:gluconolactonase
MPTAQSLTNSAPAPQARLSRARLGLGLFAASLLVLTAACSQEQKAEAPAAAAAPAVAAEGTSIERLDPALDAVIAPGAVLEKVGGGYDFTEGPAWVNGEIWFSDLRGNTFHAIAADGTARTLMEKSGGKDTIPPGSYQGSNGLVVDKDGTVLLTQHGARRIVRINPADMSVTPFLERVDGKRLNSPNDMVFSSDGALWITDPPYGLTAPNFDSDPAKEQPYNAVYRYKDGVAKAVITDLPRPNGIGFSPDGKTLYVSNCEPDMFIMAYDVAADGTVSNGRKFIEFPGPNPVDVPDGLKVDSAGNVWASGPGGIRIITPEGKVIGQLKSGDEAQANLAWGGPDWKTAYITAAGNIYKLQLAIPGQKPLYP